jgi:tetratricopeptide (TPR) repeat protein/DNA-binding XRE family transcriptional regulator
MIGSDILPFGELLRTFRERRQPKVSQHVLANMLGVDRQTIVAWEGGKYLPKDRTRVIELAEQLHLDEHETNGLLQAALLDPLPPWHVPYHRNPFFTGREKVLQSLHRKLIPGVTTALTQSQSISGLGGIGKTQVALEFAYHFRQEYRAVLWLQADSYEVLYAACGKLAQDLNLPEEDESDQTRVVEAVRHWLKKHTRWLLILDNVENQEMVDEFLPTGHHGYVLLTTRIRTTEPIALSYELERMPVQEGVLFLLRRTKILASEDSLDRVSPEDYVCAKKLWELMDGLPLALDQAGAYILETSCSIAHYLDLFEMRHDKLLERRGSFDAGHPDSVSATFSLSYEKVKKLNRAAAELLMLLAFLYPDAVPEEIITRGRSALGPTIQLVATDPIELDKALAVLLRFSLVSRNASTNLLGIHRLVQAVIKNRLTKSTRKQWAERTVRAVNRAFPGVQETDWHDYRHYVPHVQVCSEIVEQEHLVFPEAGYLFLRTGIYLYRQGQYRQAQSFYDYALAIYTNVFGSEHPYTAGVLHNLAMLAQIQERPEDAELLYTRVFGIWEKMSGPEGPVRHSILNNLAIAYLEQGKLKDAEQLLQDVLNYGEDVIGLEHPDTAITLSNLAQVYRAQDRYNEAEGLLQRALHIQEKGLESTDPSIATTLDELATIYQLLNKNDREAELLYKRSLSIKESVLGPEHPNIAITLIDLAMLLVFSEQSREEEAKELYKRAIHLTEQTFGLEHPKTIEMWEEYDDLFSL